MMENQIGSIMNALRRQPNAAAFFFEDVIKGSVRFYQLTGGVLVALELRNLPLCSENNLFFEIGIAGKTDKPIQYVVNNDGYAFSVFLTNQFAVRDVIGSTLYLYDGEDYISKSNIVSC